MAATKYRTQEVAKTPAGWRVRSKREGGHVLRIAFPPGRRKKGAGKVVEVLHPKKEKNPCAVSRKNPEELLIYGLGSLLNPTAKSHRAITRGGTQMPAGHKPGCKCPFCKRARGENPKRRLRSVRLGAGKRVKSVRRDPASDTKQAVRLFEKFHGKEPEEIAEKQVSAAIRLDYTALGDLDYLKFETPTGDRAEITFEGDGVKLASSPDGKQLYCIGGSQNLEGVLDSDSMQKDFLDLGECTEVQYVARKVHNGFEPTQWHHKFGEDTGDRPRLMYDRLRRQIFFVGGDYYIDLKGKVSPGIEN
jgi:hypothetical protein